MEEKERIAYHEAGHAVASVRYGRKFLNVTIRPDAEYKGCLKGLEELKDRRKEVIVRLAGFAADVKWNPKTESVARKGVESDDFPEAKFNLQFIQDLSPEESDLEHWILQAGKFVDENWKAIGSVAWELEKRGTLTSQEVESAIEKSDRGKTWTPIISKHF
jgi:hypothetical protein